ncbi:hypothetical protein EJ06DRAFT_533044 [Trichodelitschia bisporula]|uniref:Uncharacterized protein n=1 Tax=Trichodelitschia bisporula TaxID=703511 RepID=A0A6G1HNG1_9PEZI|nr:hypothetical protein EJ06DRAFT_533044 [Trichodelitschia bisporula]
MDLTLGVNTALGHLDSAMLVEHIAARTRRFEPDLSGVEYEDLRVPVRAIQDSTAWEEKRETKHWPEFLEMFKDKKEKLSVAPKAPGAPHTLIITASGIRAADVVRAVKGLGGKEGGVAKLFAKHIKLKEAVESCRKMRMTIGVGTPQRIFDVLDEGALSTQHLKRICIDASYIDLKKRGILDMKDTQVPLIKLLTRTDLKERYEADVAPVKLLFY